MTDIARKIDDLTDRVSELTAELRVSNQRWHDHDRETVAMHTQLAEHERVIRGTNGSPGLVTTVTVQGAAIAHHARLLDNEAKHRGKWFYTLFAACVAVLAGAVNWVLERLLRS